MVRWPAMYGSWLVRSHLTMTLLGGPTNHHFFTVSSPLHIPPCSYLCSRPLALLSHQRKQHALAKEIRRSPLRERLSSQSVLLCEETAQLLPSRLSIIQLIAIDRHLLRRWCLVQCLKGPHQHFPNDAPQEFFRWPGN